MTTRKPPQIQLFLSEIIRSLTAQGIKGATWRDDVQFAAARALSALEYGSDMSTSSLTCLEDALSNLQDAIERLKKNEGIKS